MGRTPCCVKVGLNRGPWMAEEDLRLSNYVETHGEGGWRTLPMKAGLLRCGKSCRLRWMNYLRPDVKRGKILPEEEDLILRLHRLLGNRWSLIAGRMPGRTDNEIKNYWNTHLSKKLISQGIDPRTHKPLCAVSEEGDISPNSQANYILQNGSPVSENSADPGTSDEKETAAATTEVEEGGLPRCPRENECNSEAFYVLVDEKNLTGSNQISFSQLQGGVAHENNAYFTSKSSLFNGQWNPSTDDASVSANASFQKRQVSQGLQAFEMELHNSGIAPACAKLNSNANCASAANNFSLPFPYTVITTNCMGSAFGDCTSDYVFSSLLESFGNEQLQVSETSASATHEPCLLNLPDAANLSYDLWSLLSPTMPQYHPSP